MTAIITEIGVYEAKAQLSRLLRQVQAGQHFIITHRGEPVADLVPAGTSVRRKAGPAALRMKQFMREHPPVPAIDIKALIDEGRD
jgi:prevent-host-death family protein